MSSEMVDAMVSFVATITLWTILIGLVQLFRHRARLSRAINRKSESVFWRVLVGPKWLSGDYEQTIDCLTLTLLFFIAPISIFAILFAAIFFDVLF